MRLPQKLSHLAKSLGRVAVARLDQFANSITGFGTTQDKAQYAEFVPTPRLNDQYLSNIYHGHDIARTVVDIYPDEEMREPFVVDCGDPKLNTWLDEKLLAIDARSAFKDGRRWGLCLGGSGVLLGCDDGQDVSEELIPERAKEVEWLEVYDKRFIYPYSFNARGKVAQYMLSPTSGYSAATSSIVHASRMIMFPGVPTADFEKNAINNTWDDSILQVMFETLSRFDSGWASVGHLLIEANQSVFKMAGLAEAITNGEKDLLAERLRMMDLYRSAMRSIVISGDPDANESYERVAAQFSGIDGILDRLMLRLAAAVRVPVTILMGQSPSGMNATGESDFRWFYSRVASNQNNIYDSRIRRLVDVLVKTKESPVKKAERIKVKFKPLWQETPLTEAQIRLADSTTATNYITAQVLLPEEVALSRFRLEGYSSEIMLSDAAREYREALVQEQAEPGAGESTSKVKLGVEDVAASVTLNEARGAQGLGPDKDAVEGEKKLALIKAEAEAAAQPEPPTAPEDNEAPPPIP
jgi:phage-related protein (TIGR01555 family)